MLRPLTIACTFSLLTLFFVGSVYAQLASNEDTLRGHTSIFVSVSIPDNEFARTVLNLEKEPLEGFVVHRLEQEGIHASTTFTNQTLILEIKLDLVEVASIDDEQMYVFVSHFQAIQPAKLATNRQAALATTWQRVQFGGITEQNASLLRETVFQNLEKFIADWKQVHRDSDERFSVE